MNNTSLLTQRNRRLPKHLKTLSLLLLAVVILWWFGKGVDWTEVRASIRHADIKYLVAATLVISSTYLLRTYRWRALLKPLAKANLKDLFIANVVGFSAFFVLGRAGEVVRPALLPLRDRRVSPTASFVTIFVERICDFVAIVLLFSVNLLWFQPNSTSELNFSYVREIGLVLLIGTLSGLAILFWFARKAKFIIRRLDTRVKAWSSGPKRLGVILIGMLEQIASALQVLSYPSELVVTVFWTGFLWLAIVIGNLLVIRAFGVPFGFRETIFVLGWALVGSLVPTPGGAAGAFHAAAAAGLIFLGVTRELGASIAIVVHLIDFVPAVFFALYFLVRGDVTIAPARD